MQTVDGADWIGRSIVESRQSCQIPLRDVAVEATDCQALAIGVNSDLVRVSRIQDLRKWLTRCRIEPAPPGVIAPRELY